MLLTTNFVQASFFVEALCRYGTRMENISIAFWGGYAMLVSSVYYILFNKKFCRNKCVSPRLAGILSILYKYMNISN